MRKRVWEEEKKRKKESKRKKEDMRKDVVFVSFN